MVSTHRKTPPKKPNKYEALCAHQSAMNRACFAGGRMEPIHPGGAITPRLASTYPLNPATVARKPITRSNSDIGRTSSWASILLREPTLAPNARSTPKNAPIHHVAMTPQPRARSTGDVAENTGGWKTEKYSTQMWAVNWS